MTFSDFMNAFEGITVFNLLPEQIILLPSVEVFDLVFIYFLILKYLRL